MGWALLLNEILEDLQLDLSVLASLELVHQRNCLDWRV
jgi:hypothetical protein